MFLSKILSKSFSKTHCMFTHHQISGVFKTLSSSNILSQIPYRNIFETYWLLKRIRNAFQSCVDAKIQWIIIKQHCNFVSNCYVCGHNNFFFNISQNILVYTSEHSFVSEIFKLKSIKNCLCESSKNFMLFQIF